ncbi:MAG: hypothetical protein ABIV25_02575 [Paracoccaceae bacterium]
MTLLSQVPSKATLLALCLCALAPQAYVALPARAETAIAPEKNPPGDIPDSQVFIVYSTDNYALKVPEGWARSVTGPDVSFASKLDGVAVTLTPAAIAPTLDVVKAQYVPDLIKVGRAVKVTGVSAETLAGGPVIRIDYTSNSEPNPVTTKQIRLENARFLFFKSGTMAALDLYAPAGADNVDQWQLMSRSFTWH